jgi:hypothetical protein
MLFRYVSEIKLPGNGIFLSVLPDGRGYYRKGHMSAGLGRGLLNQGWELITEPDWEKAGWEDPRAFVWKGRSYFTNNLLDRCGICDADSGHEISLPLKGKNFSYLPGSQLSCISWFNPLEIRTLAPGPSRRITRRPWSLFRMPSQASWRGGTPGVMIEEDLYAGFGHQTLHPSGQLRHYPFLWRLDLRGPLARLETRVVELPGMWPLCDPTCVLERGGNNYLITAQSPLSWFSEQPLRTAVYEFSWQELFEQLGRPDLALSAVIDAPERI